MGNPFTSPAISGYNSNPPSDDGATTEANRGKYATIKTKLSDPVKTLAETTVTNAQLAFGKVIGGAGITSTAISYTVVSGDQGKLVKATASGITITTPDATDVAAPFVFAILNNSSGSITVDGSGAQTIDGNATISLAANSGAILFTDGTNWNSTGLPGTLAGSQMSYGAIINGTITESNAGNAVTYALKTLAGTDPSSSDQVLIAFRNATAGTGNYVYRSVTAALSLTLSSGSTLGASNATAFKVWLVLFDDAGTLRLGAINTVSGTNIYPLGRFPIASSTAEGGAGAADSAQTFYTGTAVSSKAFVIVGYASYESGLTTAGSWNVSPTRIQLFGSGVPLPGETIQIERSSSAAVATTTGAIPQDDTIPQNTEGGEFLTKAITPTSAANLLRIEHEGVYSPASTENVVAALFQDSTANALAVIADVVNTNFLGTLNISHTRLATTTSSTTFKVRAGTAGGSTLTFNGVSSARLYGGVMNSFLQIDEIMT